MDEDRVQVYLETDRLLLRRLTAADLDNMCDLDSDPEVMRFLSGGAPTPRAVIQDEILPRFLLSYERFPGFGYWAAVEKSTGAFLGWVGLVPRDGDYFGDLHLGYRLRRAAWGKGYATEAARALVRKAFAELGAQRVVATTYQDNLASRRVMEKAGLTLVRSYRLTPADLAAEGTYQAASQDVWDGEDVEYALERAAWEERDRDHG